MTICPKCQGTLEQGFVPDMGYAAVFPMRWQAGRPEKNFLGSVKTMGRRQIPVTAHRCTKCGFLEFYAR